MRRSFILLVIFVGWHGIVDAQLGNTIDTSGPVKMNSRDSMLQALMRDSVIRKPTTEQNAEWKYDSLASLILQALIHHPYYDYTTPSITGDRQRKPGAGKELLFYVLVGIVMIFALLKMAFTKYFNDLFRLFFRTTLKQRQVKDQLIQTPLPSLLYNGFFVASAGMYVNMLIHYYKVAPVEFWLSYFYCCAGLAIIYTVKYLVLKLVGWILNIKDAADAYIFIVFLVNKMMGIFLLPFVIILAFSDGLVFNTSLVLSWCGIALLLVYRFILAYSALRNQVKFNLFHFLVYFAAFEIAPLLLIYRLLLLTLEKNT